MPPAGACRLPKGWSTKAFPGLGQVTSVQRAVALLVQVLFSLTLLKIQNNPTDGSRTPGVSAYMQHLKTWSTVEVAATCAYLFVSILTSSLLLAAREPGRFSGAGLLLHKVAPKSVRRDSEESVAGITFDPWIPFWFVRTARAHHCELLLYPGVSSPVGIPRDRA